MVDDDNCLKGVIPARSLLLSPPEARLADIMLRQVIAVPAGATVFYLNLIDANGLAVSSEHIEAK